MRSNDKQLEENITLNTEIENIQTELEKIYDLKQGSHSFPDMKFQGFSRTFFSFQGYISEKICGTTVL